MGQKLGDHPFENTHAALDGGMGCEVRCFPVRKEAAQAGMRAGGQDHQRHEACCLEQACSECMASM